MIHIEDVTARNVFDVCDLTTNSNGIGTTLEEYLCCNAISIAESKYYPEMIPKAIYHNEVLIGFVMYKQSDAPYKSVTLCRFMIDYKFQHKGLGREAFKAIIEFLRAQNTIEVILMIDEQNEIARNLYCSFGFEFTGRVDKNEYYYRLALQ